MTESWPKSEIYGMTSQIRRASLSIVLNLVEGYARKKLHHEIWKDQTILENEGDEKALIPKQFLR